MALPARALLQTLGYRSDKRLDLIANSAAGFQDQFDPQGRMDAAKALLADWRSIDLLQQITADELVPALSAQGQLFVNRTVDGSNIQSYLFFAVDLTGARYTRTQLAAATREINKLFPMPALVIFRHGDSLTFAIIARRVHKRDASRDVLEKVTLIKEIRCASPHRAHVEILADLALPSLAARHAIANFRGLAARLGEDAGHRRAEQEVLPRGGQLVFLGGAERRLSRGRRGRPGDAQRGQRHPPDHAADLRLVHPEKGLAPAELFDERSLRPLLRWNDPNESSYYKAILQNLFFATLNTEMGDDRRFRGKNPAGRDSHYGISTRLPLRGLFRRPRRGAAPLREHSLPQRRPLRVPGPAGAEGARRRLLRPRRQPAGRARPSSSSAASRRWT